MDALIREGAVRVEEECHGVVSVGVAHGVAGDLLKTTAQNTVAFNQFISQVFIIHFTSFYLRLIRHAES